METLYALVDSSDTIINMINWDGQPPWRPDNGIQAISVPDDQFVDIGWSYVDGNFTPPPEG